ncbi:MAG: hypothetical protein H6586_08830 [Flavobacteriales bacterium]|nr:hypothetical protein [Flavobacteriales bacterium]
MKEKLKKLDEIIDSILTISKEYHPDKNVSDDAIRGIKNAFLEGYQCSAHQLNSQSGLFAISTLWAQNGFKKMQESGIPFPTCIGFEYSFDNPELIYSALIINYPDLSKQCWYENHLVSWLCYSNREYSQVSEVNGEIFTKRIDQLKEKYYAIFDNYFTDVTKNYESGKFSENLDKWILIQEQLNKEAKEIKERMDVSKILMQSKFKRASGSHRNEPKINAETDFEGNNHPDGDPITNAYLLRKSQARETRENKIIHNNTRKNNYHLRKMF